jgi:hypothetical protein
VRLTRDLRIVPILKNPDDEQLSNGLPGILLAARGPVWSTRQYGRDPVNGGISVTQLDSGDRIKVGFR